MQNVVLLECGSNSLKVHFRLNQGRDYQCMKFPWRLGRDVFEIGELSDDTFAKVVRTVEDLAAMGFDRRNMLAIATEGLRDAQNRNSLLDQIEERLWVKVRVLSGREEASLLAEGYRRTGGGIPAFLMDIGGGSIQLVNISAEKMSLRDSLPLGAIRLHCLGQEDGRPWNRGFVEEYVATHLETACLMQTDTIHATGGTVKAAAKVLEKKVLKREEVDRLLERVERDGPPEMLQPPRREVFLPGLLVLSRVLERTGASQVRYLSISVGRIFLGWVLERLAGRGSKRAKEIVAESLRVTQIRSVL